MKVYPFLGISVVLGVVTSCQTQREATQQGVSYVEEYKMSIDSYQDTVNPQLYYHTDKTQIIVSKERIEGIKKSDAQ